MISWKKVKGGKRANKNRPHGLKGENVQTKTDLMDFFQIRDELVRIGQENDSEMNRGGKLTGAESPSAFAHELGVAVDVDVNGSEGENRTLA